MNTLYIVFTCMLLVYYMYGYYEDMRARKKIISVIDSNCIVCRCCLRKCRRKVLEIASGDKHIALKYPQKCTACGDCISVCKFNALELVNRE